MISNKYTIVAPAITAILLSLAAFAQQMPETPGETLSGRHVVLAQEVRGHAAVLVAGFSREGGNGTAAWVKAIHADNALSAVPVYEIAQIAGAPSLIRGMIRSGMKKSVPEPEHDRFLVLTQDDKSWRAYFEVSDDRLPYVMMIDAQGDVLWRGHGAASDLEPKLRDALKTQE
ncbi:MAG TPA: hypothetical protein VGL00_06550 [Terracidiphilus sp.]